MARSHIAPLPVFRECRLRDIGVTLTTRMIMPRVWLPKRWSTFRTQLHFSSAPPEVKTEIGLGFGREHCAVRTTYLQAV